MKILHGQSLVKELRQRVDKASTRIWIAVPYIGGLESVRRILGRNWIENPKLTIRLLSDTNEFDNFNSDTVKLFFDRGPIKHLSGLHAKIYITDNECLVTSANLTKTAFAKRHEVGIFLSGKDASKAIKIFEKWWTLASVISLDNLKAINKNKKSSIEERSGTSLPQLWPLPDDPGAPSGKLQKKFLNYDSLLDQYKNFANKYESVQRIWKSKPLFFEVDCFLNYLFHDATGTPSNKYQRTSPRNLTSINQMSEIEKYAAQFRNEINTNALKRYMDSSKIIRNLLAEGVIDAISKSEIRQVLDQLNGLASYPWNKTKILKENKLLALRKRLDVLVNGKGPLAARMSECNKLRNIGPSSMNEILGFTYPNKYPLINKNSNSGLRFFGYPIRAY